MKRWLFTVALAATASGSASPSISDFAWLAGAWCGGDHGIASEETWMAPRGGLVLGLHRDIRDGKAIGFEFLRIEMRDGRPAYVSQPNGRPPTVFALVSSTDRSAVFGNDRHDYPKRIRYELVDVSTLKARIDDGTEDGQARNGCGVHAATRLADEKRRAWRPDARERNNAGRGTIGRP